MKQFACTYYMQRYRTRDEEYEYRDYITAESLEDAKNKVVGRIKNDVGKSSNGCTEIWSVTIEEISGEIEVLPKEIERIISDRKMQLEQEKKEKNNALRFERERNQEVFERREYERLKKKFEKD